MALSDKPSLVLPRFTCKILQTSGATKTAKKAASKPKPISDYEFDVPAEAYEAEGLPARIKKSVELFLDCPPSFILPSTSSDGSWKWDLSNRLQILEQQRDKTEHLTPVYVRIGFIPKPKPR